MPIDIKGVEIRHGVTVARIASDTEFSMDDFDIEDVHTVLDIRDPLPRQPPPAPPLLDALWLPSNTPPPLLLELLRAIHSTRHELLEKRKYAVRRTVLYKLFVDKGGFSGTDFVNRSLEVGSKFDLATEILKLEAHAKI
jgi:hypothetical protein